MLKYINAVLIGASLLGCAGPSGIIVNNKYTDNTYPVEFSFPEIYQVREQSKNSETRVIATSLKYGKTATTVMPQFIISVFKNDGSFEEFVTKERDVHFEPELFYDYSVTNEINDKMNNFDYKLLYFKSRTMQANDNNLGIKGFINCDKFYVKIEYIANKAWYDEKEFNDILKSMSVK